MVKAVAAANTKEELETARGEAAAAVLAEKDLVVLESASMEGGGGSGRAIEGNPERVLAVIQAALDYKANNDNPVGMASAMQFGTRRSQT